MFEEDDASYRHQHEQANDSSKEVAGRIFGLIAVRVGPYGRRYFRMQAVGDLIFLKFQQCRLILCNKDPGWRARLR